MATQTPLEPKNNHPILLRQPQLEPWASFRFVFAQGVLGSTRGLKSLGGLTVEESRGSPRSFLHCEFPWHVIRSDMYPVGPRQKIRVLLGKPLDELYPVQKAGYLDCFGDKSMASSGMGVGALERM